MSHVAHSMKIDKQGDCVMNESSARTTHGGEREGKTGSRDVIKVCLEGLPSWGEKGMTKLKKRKEKAFV